MQWVTGRLGWAVLGCRNWTRVPVLAARCDGATSPPPPAVHERRDVWWTVCESVRWDVQSVDVSSSAPLSTTSTHWRRRTLRSNLSSTRHGTTSACTSVCLFVCLSVCLTERKRKQLYANQRSMCVLVILGRKCTLATSRAAAWWVTLIKRRAPY